MSPTPKKKPQALKPVIVYSRDAVLDIVQLAAGLGISVRKAESLDLPTIYLGASKRFIWGSILDVLKERAA